MGKRERADGYRAAAAECEAGGFHYFATLNREMAAHLDPPRVTREPPRARVEPEWKAPRVGKLGGDATRTGGQRDGTPLSRVARGTSPPRLNVALRGSGALLEGVSPAGYKAG
jgi:hypothetical protein